MLSAPFFGGGGVRTGVEGVLGREHVVKEVQAATTTQQQQQQQQPTSQKNWLLFTSAPVLLTWGLYY
jgi:hypothetical protein